MSNRLASSLSSVALSAVITLALLLGIDSLAVHEHAGTGMASAASAQMAAAKALQPRS